MDISKVGNTTLKLEIQRGGGCWWWGTMLKVGNTTLTEVGNTTLTEVGNTTYKFDIKHGSSKYNKYGHHGSYTTVFPNLLVPWTFFLGLKV